MYWSKQVKRKIPVIPVGIFAAFSIIKSGENFMRIRESNQESGNAFDEMDIVFKPRNIQVLSILRLLGLGERDGKIRNHVMEIRTGEGKSMILGTLSVFLALLGFIVRCVCYSEHLSERGRQLFSDTFRLFQVNDRIVYIKITQMSEDSIGKHGDIQQLTLDSKQNNSSRRKS